MLASRPILIAGAGIGGLTFALELARHGIPAAIVERAPALQEIGAGLQLSPNAGRILDRLGLGPDLDASGARPDAVRLIDGRSGRGIASIELGAAAIRRWGAPYRVIHRADLQTMLFAAVLRAGINVRLGVELIDVVEAEGRIVAHLRTSSGDETLAAHALVGADGLYSTLRARLGAAAPRFSGQIAWRAIVDLEARNETGLWLGPGAHLVTYRLSRTNALNLVAITDGPAADHGWGSPGDPAELAHAFRGWAKAPRALIKAAPGWTRWPLYDLDPMQVWGRGRTTLIGDAAHAMLPHLAQGAAMAIEDATVLAARLARTPDRPDLAFRSYEADRQPRTEAAYRAARRNGRIYRLPTPAALARDATLRLLGPERLTTRLDWLYGHRAE